MIKDINTITPEYFKYRLEQETEQYKQEIEKLQNQLQQKENIIKEVKEYIESYNLPKDLGHLGEAPISIRELRDILEILDKGE